jgi:peptidoglycan/LPS O-acetylase OafA/YrhL
MQTAVFAPAKRASLNFRPEIEGLRAVAVLLVVFDHLAGWPKGGFIGVDVFFVISGFLITGLLVKEHDRTGRISMKGFYQRRARRILPAAVTVLVATWITSKIVFFSNRAHDTGVDILWSAGFLANIHFARAGTDYFNADKPPSPVQHFWSLAVEEQFYIFWPLVLMALMFVFLKITRRHARALLLSVASILLIALFYMAVKQTHDNKATAYFNTSSRAWELGVGAVLAIATPFLLRSPQWLRSFAVVAGLVTIAISAFTISEGGAFPAPSAVGPVIGTALVIYGSGGSHVSRWSILLTNPISRYVGRVSYSLYLWHWPVIVILAAEISNKTTSYKVIAILAMSALTIASYHFVESPLRTMRWRSPQYLLTLLRTRQARKHERIPRKIASTGPQRALVAVVALVELTVMAYYLRPTSTPKTFDVAAAVGSGTATAAPTLAVGEIAAPTDIATDINSALAAQSWPKLNPTIGNLASAKAPEWTGCGNVGEAQVKKCTFTTSAVTAAKTVVVIGDSIGISWLPTIRAAMEPKGWTVVALTYGQCPAATVDVKQEVGAASTFTAACNDHRTFAINKVAALKPGLVILASAENSMSRLSSGATGTAAATEWGTGTTKTIAAVKAAGAARVVVMSPPPSGDSLEACATADSTPGDCVSTISDTWHSMTDAERSATTASQSTYLDTRLLFCSPTEYCPPYIGTTPIRVDGNHITSIYAERVAPAVANVLLGA